MLRARHGLPEDGPLGVRGQEQRALIDVPALTRAAERVLVAMRAACRAFLAAVDRKPYASKWETTHMSVYGMWNSDIDGAFVHCDRDHADVEADVRRGLGMLGQDLDAFSLTCAAVDWGVCGPLMDDTSDLALPHLERDPYPVRCDAMPNLHAALDAVRDCLLPRYAAPSAYLDRLALACAVREALGNSWTTKPRTSRTTRPVPSKEAVREAFAVLQDQYASGRITGRQEVARALGSGWLARMGVNSARFRGLAATFAAALGDTAGMLGAEPIVPAVPAVHAPARLPLSVVVRRVFDMDTARLLAGSGGLAWMAPPDGDGHGHGPARSTALSVAINEGTTRDPVAAAVTELFQNAVDATRGAPNEADRGVVHIDMAVHGGFVEVAVSNPGTMAPENLLALSVPFLSTKDPAAVAAAASAGEMGSGFFTVYRPPMAHVRISSGRVVIEDTPVRDAQDRAVDVDRVWAQTTGAGDGWTRVGLLLPRSEASRFAPPVHALVTQRLAVLCPRLRLNGRLLRTDKEWGVDVVRVAGDAEIAALYAVLPVANMAMLPSHVFTREVPLRPLDWLLDGLRLDGQDEDGVPPWVRSLLAQGVAVELASGAFEPVQTRSKARLRERTAAFVARTLLHADALHALLGILHRRGLHPEGFPNAQSSIGIYQVLPHLIAERPHPARLASYASESDFWFNYRPSGATRSVSALLHELVPLRTAQWAERVRLAGLDPNVTQAITDWLEPKLDQETEARMESRASGAREAEVPRPVLPESASVQERADADAAWARSVAAVRSAEIACIQAYVDVLWPLLFTPEERAVVPADAPRVLGLVPPDISALAQAAYRADDRTVMVNLETQAWPPRIARAMESGVFDAGFRSALMFGPPAKWIGTHPDATIRHELEHARHHALFVAGRTGFASLDHMAAHPPDFVAQLDARFERILGETSFLTDVHRAMLAAVRAH